MPCSIRSCTSYAVEDACPIGRLQRQFALDDALLADLKAEAHEDDAQRAVRAGLGMVAALGQLNTRLA